MCLYAEEHHAYLNELWPAALYDDNQLLHWIDYGRNNYCNLLRVYFDLLSWHGHGWVVGISVYELHCTTGFITGQWLLSFTSEKQHFKGRHWTFTGVPWPNQRASWIDRGDKRPIAHMDSPMGYTAFILIVLPVRCHFRRLSHIMHNDHFLSNSDLELTSDQVIFAYWVYVGTGWAMRIKSRLAPVPFQSR